ncbi:MAG: hypothetical protein AB7F88_06910 [Pyrinomonadaceae bacterium]
MERTILSKLSCLALAALLLASCTGAPVNPAETGPTALKEVPAVRLNYRYEADVPPPTENKPAVSDERNAAVQADFDNNRLLELLDKTFTSPDGKRVVAAYHLPLDRMGEFRLDMYSSDGRLLKKISSDAMAVRFPDTIVWSPDSSTVAFMAKTRGLADPMATPAPTDEARTPVPTATPTAEADANTNTTPADPEANANAELPPAQPTPAAPDNVLTFRTEQIYTCNAEGDGVKPLTQSEGLIYFYFVWSPDSSMLASIAATGREWQVLEARAEQAKEHFVPLGRPRVIEKNGRERRLDDGLTAAQPVWSPDSAKIACAFNDQVRIYDAGGDAPTQAAIPLRNDLLLSSQAYDREQASQLSVDPVNTNTNAAANSNANGNANTNAAALPPGALPDPNTLVSFNPIVMLKWPTEDQLYFQTAFVKRMKNDADSVMSFARWHRLILTPQPSAAGQ